MTACICCVSTHYVATPVHLHSQAPGGDTMTVLIVQMNKQRLRGLGQEEQKLGCLLKSVRFQSSQVL